MTPLPAERAERRDQAFRLAVPVPFDPSRAHDSTRLAVSCLYALTPGWYRRADLVVALDAVSQVGRRRARSVLVWLARDGVLTRHERDGREVLLWIDVERLRAAWPDFAPNHRFDLGVSPVDVGA
jgi:hypothetical protein